MSQTCAPTLNLCTTLSLCTRAWHSIPVLVAPRWPPGSPQRGLHACLVKVRDSPHGLAGLVDADVALQQQRGGLQLQVACMGGGARGRKALRRPGQSVGGLHTAQQWCGMRPHLPWPHLPRRPPSSSSECTSQTARRPPCTSCGRRHYCLSSCAHPQRQAAFGRTALPSPQARLPPMATRCGRWACSTPAHTKENRWPLSMQQRTPLT